jgi:hypothetical protein
MEDSMTQLIALKLRKDLALIALFFGMTMTTLPRAVYGQEVDPAWFDPAPVAAKSSPAKAEQPQMTAHKDQMKVKSTASAQRTAKARVKKSATHPS